MPVRRTAVRWLTFGVAVAVAAAGGFAAIGGLGGVRELAGADGLWSVPAGRAPAFTAPTPVLAKPSDKAKAKATADGAAKVLGPLAGDPRLGRAAVSVIDVATGKELFDRRADDQVTPASNTKIVTAAALLAAVGPQHRFATKVVAGSAPGEVVLVGSGDPTLTIGPTGSYPGAARLDELAKKVKAAGRVTKLIYDSTLFSGPTLAPGWDADTVEGGFAAPIVALMIDGGRVKPTPARLSPEGKRSSDPALFAAKVFAKLLGGVPVAAGQATRDAKEIAHVDSAPAQAIVEQMLQTSDNVLAETLLRQVAVAKGQPASFVGASAARKAVLAEAGIDQTGNNLIDGSGLSRLNKVSASLLTSVLRAVTDPGQPKLRGVLAGLPVAGFSGTLRNRFAQPAGKAGAGDVRAKTGTLDGVNALAGVVVTKSGQQLAFAAIANDVPAGPKAGREAALDAIGAALASCGC